VSRAAQARRRWILLAAAAVLLVAASVLLTLQFTAPHATPTLPPAAGVIPASTRAWTRPVQSAAIWSGCWSSSVTAGGDHCDTRAHLAIIDRAIEESRAALAADPANRDLRALLLGAHRQKLDLLERATRSTRS
jgi:hypothetical protein